MLMPFTGLLVRQDWAARVVPPAEDALPAPGPAALERLIAAGAYQPFDTPSLFVYRLRSGGHVQTGVVGVLPVTAFDGSRVRGHEQVSARRVELLADYIAEVGAVSTPIALGHRSRPGVHKPARAAGERPPALDVVGADGTAHTVWQISDRAGIDALGSALADSVLYITDGHHRAAAAAQAGRGDDTVLVACFPQDELRVLPFHRRVRGPIADVAVRLRSAELHVEAVAGPDPSVADAITTYASRRWWRVRPLRPRPPGVEGLLVTVLHRELLGPGFGITDVEDCRLELISGAVPVPEITAQCDADGGVAFLLAAPEVEEVFRVADRGESMPAKSTFFHPKPRSGVFLQHR